MVTIHIDEQWLDDVLKAISTATEPALVDFNETMRQTLGQLKVN